DGVGNVGAIRTVQVTPAREKSFLLTAVEPDLPRQSESGSRQVQTRPAGKTLQVYWQPWYAKPPAMVKADPGWSADDGRFFAWSQGGALGAQLWLLGEAQNVKVQMRWARNSATSVGERGDELTEAGETENHPALKISRLHFVSSGRGWTADPLVPWVQGDKLPTAGQRGQLNGQPLTALWLDWQLPLEIKPGVHRGMLQVECDGDRLELPVTLRVWDFEMPAELCFVPQMNAYGRSVPAGHELEYYRLAQEHRTCLNRLPYNWRGQTSGGPAPVWDREKLEFDWSEYDRQIGPLADGSAFADLPRGAVPVEATYLPVNENWPVPIEEGFKGGYWAEDALTPAYRDELKAAIRALAEHIHQRGWSRTQFEFFLNGKLQFKQTRWSAASAPWTFDEPVNAQDFAALRWYGRLVKDAVSDFESGISDFEMQKRAFCRGYRQKKIRNSTFEIRNRCG
ncbi:MAG: hypothetical protein HC898_10360, partial [Phycisphaerales bacterium]|nr:hypothetical protein [Phycisphaerales bacterium]